MSKILYIDNDTDSRNSFYNSFKTKYEVFIADSIKEAENLIVHQEDLAVIITGHNMPQNEGLAFFEKTKSLFYNSVRIYISSRKDFDIAVEAVNRCYIFRFHLFPCPAKILEQSIEDALDLYWKQKDLYLRAISDNLTGLLNRGRLIEELTTEISRSKRYKLKLSVGIIDIDFFKKVNDTFGHHEGDLVLKECSELFINSKRDTDTFGRYGGEEFLFILPETSLQNATIFIERIRNVISNYIFGENKINITISSGITECTSEDDYASIINRADVALYQAKELGRNRTEII